MRPLFKTTIVIWSDFDPVSAELSELAREAEVGEAYCSRSARVFVQDPVNDPDWDGTEFFGDLTDEEDGE